MTSNGHKKFIMQKFLLCTLVWNGIPAKCMRLYKSQVLRFIKKLFKRFWNVHNNNFKYEPQYHLDLDYSYQAKCPRCVREYFYQEIGIRDAQLSKNTLRHIIMLYMVHVNMVNYLHHLSMRQPVLCQTQHIAIANLTPKYKKNKISLTNLSYIIL